MLAPHLPAPIHRCRTVVLPEGVVRQSRRPVAMRDDAFEREFDATTLFFDAFASTCGRFAILPGPELNTLDGFVRGLTITSHPGGGVCRFRVRHLDRHAQVWAEIPPGTTALDLRHGSARLGRVTLHPSGVAAFAGKRALLAISKDNPIRWIEDWARYNRDIHGADAILVYDNGSTAYSRDELHDRLARLAGFDTVAVVDWPYKFGPQSTVRRYWDSDFGHLGAWEHARWLFLSGAAGVINSDVDELVLPAKSGAGLFQALARSIGGAFHYYGRWVPGIEGVTPDVPAGELTHRDFRHFVRKDLPRVALPVLDRTELCPLKWAVDPRRCPSFCQWGVHRILRWPLPLTSGGHSYRHYRTLSTSWKYDRRKRETFDPVRHCADAEMAAVFGRVDWFA